MRGRARTAAPLRPEITEPKLRTVPPQDLPAMPPPPAIEPPQAEPPAAAVGPIGKPSKEEPKALAPQAAKPAEPSLAAPAESAEQAASTDECASVSVYFPTDATVFKDEGVTSLNRVADCLKANPTRIVLLEGSADPRGDAASNSELAKGRAQAVAEQLWALGVSTAQISLSTVPAQCTDKTQSCWQSDRSVKATLSDSTQP